MNAISPDTNYYISLLKCGWIVMKSELRYNVGENNLLITSSESIG